VSDLVRPAVGTDAPAIHEVHRAAWLETYPPLVPVGEIEERFANRELRIARWIGIIANERTVVAERDGRVVGWAASGPGRGDDPPRPTELEGIYLLAEAHGSGLGQELLDAVIGGDPAYLWVAEGNDRAEAFYRRNGFARDGAIDEHPVGASTLEAVRMVRP
jgi:GNAT superfamily N-acetyltransferase